MSVLSNLATPLPPSGPAQSAGLPPPSGNAPFSLANFGSPFFLAKIGPKSPKGARFVRIVPQRAPKMEPKSIPGPPFFRFGDPLFSCNTTCFWLNFRGLGGRRTHPKRAQNADPEKKRAQIAPRADFLRIMWPRAPKTTPKRVPNVTIAAPFFGPGGRLGRPMGPRRCPEGEKRGPGLKITCFSSKCSPTSPRKLKKKRP